MGLILIKPVGGGGVNAHTNDCFRNYNFKLSLLGEHPANDNHQVMMHFKGMGFLSCFVVQCLLCCLNNS